ncbi:MAG TPA: acyl-CoA dehydrogenase family protein [Actinophytocola sp.]|jgi:alkylation response protein AidB-like acyl-CoA dehydrogenase|uniref:acyl-CoA dehydrogenase family protein n=1 Tax=Actinophytocola sp. TaxID=1872138 RepID=UPI002E0B5D85|nr:acyl-CoA dehydrogenase family protein [Actinophytocola sp.]
MTIIAAASRPDLVRRATDLVDLIRKHAAWQEENRTLHEEVLQGIADAELLKMRRPARYGGSEADVRTVVDVVAELARGDGSTGWSVATMTLGSWRAGLFPDEVQDEIFADPDVRLCGSVSPTGFLTPTDGGYILNGEWQFITGAPHAKWIIQSVLLATEDGNYVPAAAAVPMSDVTIIDDWRTSGMRATSSVSTAVKDLFVPAARVLPMLPVLLEGQHQSAQNADHQVWKTPFMPLASAVGVAPLLGMARAAQDAFFERLPDRRITYTSYERQIDAPLTHLQVAEAAVKIDEAEFHVHRVADCLDSKAGAGEWWNLQERVVARMDAGAATQLVTEAVGVLNGASGASSVYSHVPIQRIVRDVDALGLNAALVPSTNLELYGRVLVGLEPNTQFL